MNLKHGLSSTNLLLNPEMRMLQAAQLSGADLRFVEGFLFGDTCEDPVYAHRIAKTVYESGRFKYPTIWHRAKDYVNSYEFQRLEQMAAAEDAQIKMNYIDVDGVYRSRFNALNEPIHQTEEGIINFWRWYAGSKLVDSSGRPLVFYHGGHFNPDTFECFDPALWDEENDLGQGFYFSSNYDDAARYDYNQEYGNSSVLSVYIKSVNPWIIEVAECEITKRNQAESRGHDLIVDRTVNFKFADEGYVPPAGCSHVLAFCAGQIKSTKNNGEFNPNSDNIYDYRRNVSQDLSL